MSDRGSKLAPVRTFAQDLERQRRVDGSSRSTKTSETLKASPPQHTDSKSAAPKKVTPPPPPTETTTPPLTENPPFHAFKKKAKPALSIDTKEVEKSIVDKPSSVLTQSHNNVSLQDDEMDVSDATIITDTKRKRFSLTQALIESLTDWWSNTKETYLEKKQPKYMVPDAERRKGVIQQATSKTGRASAADHGAVVARLRAHKRAGHPAQTDHVETDPAHLLEAPDTDGWEETPTGVHNVNFEVRKSVRTASDTPTPPPTKTIAPLPAKPAIKPIVVPVVPEVVPTSPAAAPAPKTVVPTVPAPAPSITPTVPAPTPVPVPTTRSADLTPTPATDAVVPEQTMRIPVREQLRRKEFSLYDTNTAALSVVALLVIVVTGFVGIRALVGFVTDSRSGNEQFTPAPQFINSTVTTSVLPNPTRAALATSLSAATESETPIIEVTYLHTDAASPISAHELLQVINSDLPVSFTQSVTGSVFGSYRGAPFILLNTTDIATARGGMLAWESTIDRDFSQLWQVPNRSVGQTFTDMMIESVDVRALGASDTELIVLYGFVTPNQLLITTNTTAFINLVQSLQR